MKDNISIFVFGMHQSLLTKVIASLNTQFEHVNGTTQFEDVLAIMKSTPPDIIVIGGGVSAEMRGEIFKTKVDLMLKTLIAEPNGPRDVIASIVRAE